MAAAASKGETVLSTVKLGKYNIPLNIGKESSIGDVSTIRSQLQHRRTQLNRDISVEQQITKSTRKLAKMPSLNKKTKEQASLEHQFSVSKIQLLQAELTKINSSLQAYQPESCRDTQIPLIPLSTKTTARISFVSPISELAQKHYYIDPILIQDALYDFQELRFSIAVPTKDDAGIHTLFEYISHLSLVAKRFIHPKLSHGISFIWHDAISGYPAAQQSTVYEKACVIFNIGSLYTQIAAQQDRGTIEGIKSATNYLEKSLGIFEYMKANFSYSPTMDMTPEVLAFFSDLVRAQAVELQWDIVIMKGLDEKNIKNLVDYSQQTKSISECYKPLRELVDEVPLKDYIPQTWSALIKIKDAHYKALAHYYAATIHERMYMACTGSSSSTVDIDEHRASIATELHFLYTSDTTNIEELFSIEPTHQMGFAKSHLNCAAVLHEYALKFKGVCKQLDPIVILQKVLEDASGKTQSLKDQVSDMTSVAMISPAVQPSIIELDPVLPSFTKIKVKDSFKAVGPLPKFSAEGSWGPPRKLTLSKRRSGYGFTVRGSKPVRISGVDTSDERGLIIGDWIISINGRDVRSSTHTDVVELIRNTPHDLLELEVMTPAEVKQGEDETPPTPTSSTPPTEM